MSEGKTEPRPSPSTSTTSSEKQQLPVEVFREMERRDENQILAEMRGELLEDLVYSVEIQGKHVTNLSYAGVKEAIRRRGNLEILEVRTEETSEEIRALIRVRDHDNRIDVLGASSAEKAKPFAYTLAVNKAERNAFAKLIPAKWFAVLIDEYLERKKGKAAPPEPALAGAPPPSEEWQPTVPITKDPVSEPEVRQFPLVKGTQAVGMLNLKADMTEAALVPEKPVPVDDSALTSFLYPRVLDGIKEKHPGVEWSILKDEAGQLKAILLRGPLLEEMIKELQHAVQWAFEKAMARKEPASGQTAG